MRKWIIIAAFLLVLVFLVIRFAELETMLALLRDADWRFFIPALALQLLWFGVVALSYRFLYTQMGIDEGFGRLLVLTTAANFATIIAPSGGATGLAIFLADGRRKGHSLGHILVSCVLYMFNDYLAILLVALAGFVALDRRGLLGWPAITAALLVAAVLILLVLLLLLGARSIQKLGDGLALLARTVNRILHPFLRAAVLSEKKAYALALDTAEAVSVLSRRPALMLPPFLLALLNKGMMLLILLLTFLAFQVNTTMGGLIAGYGQGYLFTILTPSPSTFGVVEGLLTFSLTTLGHPLEAATIVALGFRTITFWIPFFVGLWSFQQLARPIVAPSDAQTMLSSEEQT